MVLFDGLIDKHTESVLRHFLSNQDEFFHITQTAEMTGVPTATAFRIIKRFAENNILEVKRLSKLKLYRLKDNEKTRRMRRWMG